MALALLGAGPLAGQDARHPALRRALASRPTDSLAVWILVGGTAAPAGAVSRTPADSALLARIRETGARVRYASRWLGAVAAVVDSAAAARLAALGEVRRILPQAKLDPAGAWPAGSVDAADAADAAPGLAPAAAFATGGERLAASAAAIPDVDYGAALAPLQQIGVPAAHALGFTGRGVRIALLDTGFKRSHEALAPLTVVAARDFVNGDTIVSDEPPDPSGTENHGTGVWSLLAAYRPGTLIGPAFEAEFALAKIALPGSREDEALWVQALEWAVDSVGVDIVVSSLGFRFFSDGTSYDAFDLDGNTAVSTVAADEAARRGVLVLNSAGNFGPASGSLVAPADADSIIAVGAVDSLGQPLGFSGRGPTSDGRIKPELVARGQRLRVASFAGTAAYQFMNGADAATALVGGAAAIVMQALRETLGEADAMAVRRALMESGSNAFTPGGALGHGLPDVVPAILFPDGLHTVPLAEADAEGTLRTLGPHFEWTAGRVNPLAGQIVYRLELADDPSFTRILHADSVTDASTLGLTRAFGPGTSFWWRVVARTQDGIVRTTAPRGPFTVPEWVRLDTLAPASVVYIETARPKLKWSALPAPPPIGPLRYDVQILSARDGVVVQEVPNLRTDTVTLPVPLAYNHPYLWRVIARSPLGVADTAESVGSFVVTSRVLPPTTLLHQNFPNPFPRPELGLNRTRIWFDLEEQSVVELTIHDLRGHLVRRLIPDRGCGRVVLAPGLYGREEEGEIPCVQTRWDGRDDSGRLMPRGVYIVRLSAAGRQFTRRIVFLPDGS